MSEICLPFTSDPTEKWVITENEMYNISNDYFKEYCNSLTPSNIPLLGYTMFAGAANKLQDFDSSSESFLENTHQNLNEYYPFAFATYKKDIHNTLPSYLLNNIDSSSSTNCRVITQENTYNALAYNYSSKFQQTLYDGSTLNTPNFFIFPGLRFWRNIIPCIGCAIIDDQQLDYFLTSAKTSYTINYNNTSYTFNGFYFPYIYCLFSDEPLDHICNNTFWDSFLFSHGTNDPALITNPSNGTFNVDRNNIYRQKMNRLIRNERSIYGAYYRYMPLVQSFNSWKLPEGFSYPTPSIGGTGNSYIIRRYAFSEIYVSGSSCIQYLYIVCPSFITKIYGKNEAYGYGTYATTNRHNAINQIRTNEYYTHNSKPLDLLVENEELCAYLPYFTRNFINIYKFVVRVGTLSNFTGYPTYANTPDPNGFYWLNNNLFKGMHISLTSKLESSGSNITIDDSYHYCQEYNYTDAGLRIWVDDFYSGDESSFFSNDYGFHKEDWMRGSTDGAEPHCYTFTGQTITSGSNTYYLWKRTDGDAEWFDDDPHGTKCEFLLTSTIDYADLFMSSAEYNDYYFSHSCQYLKGVLYGDQEDQYDEDGLSDVRLIKVDKYTTGNQWLKNIWEDTITSDAAYEKYKTEYFTTIALEAGTITLVIPTMVCGVKMTALQYRKNNGSWTQVRLIPGNSATVSVTVVKNDVIEWRGTGNSIAYDQSSGKHACFRSTCKFNIQGNIGSLLTSNFSSTDYLTTQNAFYGLFNKNNNASGVTCSLISARNLYIRSNTNTSDSSASYVLSNMFAYETLLRSAPYKINVTSYGSYSCDHMFYGCTSLRYAPKLPATTLKNYCYNYMFNGCIGMSVAPILPAQTLVNYCYNYMFYGCSSLAYIATRNSSPLSNTYSSNWVSGIQVSSGKFISPITTNPTGVNGKPSQFTLVQTAANNRIWTQL